MTLSKDNDHLMASSSRHISEYFLATIFNKNTFVARPLYFRFLLRDCDVIKFEFSLFRGIVFILGSYCGIKLKQNKHQCISATKNAAKHVFSFLNDVWYTSPFDY